MIHIMMATYNGQKYICEQIESILKQTYTEWKLFISDDGSTDQTKEMIKKYHDMYPEKIFLVKSRNGFHNAKDNFAYLFRVVPKAEYYAFCDQDDIWLIDKLDKMLHTIQKKKSKNILLAYHDMLVGETLENVKQLSYFKYTKLNLDNKYPLQQILLYNVIPGCSMIFNHELRKIIADIPNECFMHDWWIVLVTLCCQGQVIFVDEALSVYRQHAMNEIGAVVRPGMLYYIKKSISFFNVLKYHKNNERMKKIRYDQTMQIIKKYNMIMDEEDERELELFINILTSKNRLWAYKIAQENHFMFYNKIYTLKFLII